MICLYVRFLWPNYISTSTQNQQHCALCTHTIFQRKSAFYDFHRPKRKITLFVYYFNVFTFVSWRVYIFKMREESIKKVCALVYKMWASTRSNVKQKDEKKVSMFLPLRRAQCEVLCASTKYKAFFVFFLLLLNYARVEGGMRAIYIGSTRWSQTHASLCCCIHNSRVRIQTNILANILEKVSLGK